MRHKFHPCFLWENGFRNWCNHNEILPIKKKKKLWICSKTWKGLKNIMEMKKPDKTNNEVRLY